MRYAIVVGLVAATLCGREQATGQERGILSFKATIVKVHDKSLELSVVDRDEDIPRGKSIRFDVAKDTRLEEVDFKLVDGKLETTRKAIALGDLLPTQPINIIAISAGDRPTILVGVVAGGRASGAEALKLIAQLGGTVRNFAWKKGDTRYEVDLSNSKITDDALALIASMDDLDTLDLSKTKITDKGIAHLANHAKLSDIMLSGTQVTNGVLTHLSTLRTLDRVYVDHVHFDLLTQEALRDLMAKTTPDGVVCYHTSHRTHEFFKPLSTAAAALGFAWKKVNDSTFDDNGQAAFADDSHFSCEWLVVARRPEHLARFRSEKSKTRNLTWDVPPADDAPAWRDGVEPEMPIRRR